MYGLITLLFITTFTAFLLVGFLRREFYVPFYLAIIYLVAITVFIILESNVVSNYVLVMSIIQYLLLPPLGIPLGYGIREFMDKVRDRDYQGGIVIVRKLLPIIYIVYLLYTASLIIPALILSALLSIIEWYEFRSDKFGLVLTMLNTLVLIFMPIALAIPSTIIVALALDTELLRGLRNPWLVALAYTFSALLAYPLLGLYRALIIVIPITYVILIVVIEAIMYLMTHFSVEVKMPLRTVEGKEFMYDMILMSRPRVNALITVSATDNISLVQPSRYFNGSLALKARAIFEKSGIFNPKVIIDLEDPRGFIRLRRVVDHDPIIVIPRSTYVLGLYQRMLSGSVVRGLGEITEVRDYTPGDSVRKIHWAKSAKFDKYVVKVSSKFTSAIAIIPHASNARNLNRIEEILMTTVVNLLSQGVVPTFLIIDPINYNVISTKWGNNYIDILTNVLNRMSSLDIKYLSRGPGSEIFQGIRMIHRENIMRAFSRVRIERPLILIGEERLSSNVLKALQELIGRENVRYILI